MTHTLKPDAQGNIIIDNETGTIKPGDTVCITGNPKSVLFTNLAGSANARINITNLPGEKLTIGNPAWSGGGFSYGIMFKRCKYINLFGSDKTSFVIAGSKVTTVDRGAYFNCRIDELSDNFSVHDISVKNGGNGIWCKTEVSKTDPATWSPAVLENFEFYNLDIRGTYTEGLYVGHTGTWWNISTNQPYYSGTPTDLNTYKQPVKLKNVVIRNCYLEGCGLDGIQTSAIDGLQIYDNEVVNWGTRKDSSHSGGILVGGRVNGFKVYNNYVHDGWGQMIQVFAEGGASSVILNNLLVNNSFGEGVFIRGTNNLVVELMNNTIVGSTSQNVRVNGSSGAKGKQIISGNILAGPKTWLDFFGDRNFIYTEEGGTFQELTNAKFRAVADAKLDPANAYQPVTGSTADGLGYEKPVTEPPVVDPPAPAKITITSNELATLLKALTAGTIQLEAVVDSVTKKITVKVE